MHRFVHQFPRLELGAHVQPHHPIRPQGLAFSSCVYHAAMLMPGLALLRCFGMYFSISFR